MHGVDELEACIGWRRGELGASQSDFSGEVAGGGQVAARGELVLAAGPLPPSF